MTPKRKVSQTNEAETLSKKPAKGPAQRLSKQEMIAALLECREKLGRVPGAEEFLATAGVRLHVMKRLFGKYGELLRAARLEREGTGYRVHLEALFIDWAEIVRKLGRLPTIADYQTNSRYSMQPLRRRFGGWKRVPLGLLLYAEQNYLENEWQDVLDMVRAARAEKYGANWRSRLPSWSSSSPGCLPILRKDRTTFGPSLMPVPMSHAPTNENGVLFLFGILAAELGFVVMKLQSEFPDCKAMRKIDEKCWQEVWIEFEFESRNFLAHKHRPDGCDLIVCWEHNWEECPLEVVELKSVLARRVSTLEALR